MTKTPNNLPEIVPVSGRQLAAVGASAHQLPVIFLRSESGSKRFWEFFSANGFILYGRGGEIATNRAEDQEITNRL